MNYLTLVFPEFVKSVDTIVWCAFGGVVLGAALSLYFKDILGAFVRFLIKEGANSPETALVLEKTKFAKNPFVRLAIKNGTYKRVVKYTCEDDSKLKMSQAILKRGYYIPPELIYEAENIFSKNGTNLLTLVLTVIAFLVVAVLSLIFIPDIIAIFNAFFGLS